MLKTRIPFHGLSADVSEQRDQEREIARLQKKAAKLGFTLAPSNAA